MIVDNVENKQFLDILIFLLIKLVTIIILSLLVKIFKVPIYFCQVFLVLLLFPGLAYTAKNDLIYE